MKNTTNAVCIGGVNGRPCTHGAHGQPAPATDILDGRPLCFDHARGYRMKQTRQQRTAEASTGIAAPPETPTAAIYALVDPAEPHHVRYVGSTVQPLSVRLQGHLNAPAAEVRRWLESIAPRTPTIIQLHVLDVDPDHVTAGNVAEGPVHDAEYAVMDALKAIGHHLVNTSGQTIARPHKGTGRHQGGTHPSALAGARAQRSGPHGNGSGRCARPGCANPADPHHRLPVSHYDARVEAWDYCSPGCRHLDDEAVRSEEL